MRKLILIPALASLAGCISPHGMQAVGGADDAGYTYHTAQACTDGPCGGGIGSAALYGPVRADGSRDIVPLGSVSIMSTGATIGIVGGIIAAGVAAGLSRL